MKWIVEQLVCEEKEVLSAVNQYAKTPLTVESLSMMILKCEQKSDTKLLFRVIDTLENEYTMEKNILKQFIDSSFSYYKKYNGYDFYLHKLKV